jgi:hypothetical protein
MIVYRIGIENRLEAMKRVADELFRVSHIADETFRHKEARRIRAAAQEEPSDPGPADVDQG